MSITALRLELADALAAGTSALAVHAHPAEVTALPAIVIHPAAGASYVEPFTLSNTSSVLVQLVLELIVNRTDLESGLAGLEELFAECVSVLTSGAVPGAPRWQSLADLGDVTVGGSEALSAQLSVAVPTDLPNPSP